MYADNMTKAMTKAIDETNRRRNKQIAYNKRRGITPVGVVKGVRDMIEGVYDPQEAQQQWKAAQAETAYTAMSEKDLAREIKRVEKGMLDAARNLEFERAAELRDELKQLKQRLFIGLAA